MVDGGRQIGQPVTFKTFLKIQCHMISLSFCSAADLFHEGENSLTRVDRRSGLPYIPTSPAPAIHDLYSVVTASRGASVTQELLRRRSQQDIISPAIPVNELWRQRESV